MDWAKINDQTNGSKLSLEHIFHISKNAILKAPEDESAVWCFNDLQRGDDGFYIVGDQLSSLPGWQEGAVSSALVVFGLVNKIEGYEPSKLVLGR